MDNAVEQRTQAVIDFNKQLEVLPSVIAQLTQEQKEELAEQIQQRKQELGLS